MKYYCLLTNEKWCQIDYDPWKMFDFISFSLFGFILAIKLGNIDFESQWNNLICFGKKYMTSDLNMFLDEMVEFVSSPLFGFTLVIKLTNFDLESHWNTLIFFTKNIWRHIQICHMKKCLILFHFHCLGSF